MADTKVSNLTAATDLVAAEIAGQQGGTSKKFTVAIFDARYQGLDSDLTSWAGVTRASGFDTWTATPSSANLRSLLTDETGTGAAVFADAPTISGIPVFSGIPSLTGGALSFPSTQVASAGANDLDDYEEGTFTPAFSASGATFSYATQSGVYTKIGRMVLFEIVLSLNTSGNTLTANALTVTGLPFSAAAGQAGFFPIRWANSTTSYVGVNVRVATTTLAFEGLTAAATTNSTALNSNALLHATNGSVIQLKGFYYV